MTADDESAIRWLVRLMIVFLLAGIVGFVALGVLGHWLISNAWAHDPYSSWKDNRGYSCCNGDGEHGDCRPTTICEAAHGQLGVVMYGHCVPVPPEVVLHIPSPDNRTHACMREGALQPMCVVIGPQMY